MNADVHRVCLIEDDEVLGEALRERLEVEGFACDWFPLARPALAALLRGGYDAVISDIQFPDFSGEELFRRLADTGRALPPFVFMTGFGTIDAAVRLLKMGAEDYLTKPFDVSALVELLRGLCDRQRSLGAASNPLGVSAAMRSIDATVRTLGPSGCTVLVTGESGVGKEYVVRALHRYGDPAGRQPLVAVNCAALAESLLEAELFGHERGAFTGAVRDRKGVFERSQGGTLFLDEIGDMPLAMQSKLLRVLTEREIVRVGGEKAVRVNFRLVCATNMELRDMVAAGEFRQDLFYRIRVAQVHVPPLRERPQDIAWLADRILQECAREHGGAPRRLNARAERAMLAYPWPGNVRELRNCLERACVMSSQPVLTEEVLLEGKSIPPADADASAESLAEYVRSCERRYIGDALERHGFRIAETAAALGISRKNLWEKMRKLDLSTPAGESDTQA